MNCQCGDIFNVKCNAVSEDMIMYEYMPDQFKSSHEAAGNYGEYPLNGAKRILVTKECYETIEESKSED